MPREFSLLKPLLQLSIQNELKLIYSNLFIPHLIRPEQQHFLDGRETGLPEVVAGEAVTEGQQAAGHVRHVLPLGQDGPELLGPGGGPHCLDQVSKYTQQLPQVLQLDFNYRWSSYSIGLHCRVTLLINYCIRSAIFT